MQNKKGWFDSKLLPHVAGFHQQPKPDQDLTVKVNKYLGLGIAASMVQPCLLAAHDQGSSSEAT